MEDLAARDNQFKISCSDATGNSNDFFYVTNKAYDTICRIRANNDIASREHVRLSAYGGGCAGIRHDLGFDSKLSHFDKVFPCGELKLVVDAESLAHLQGVTLDYQDGIRGSGFVFNNPINVNCGGCPIC